LGNGPRFSPMLTLSTAEIVDLFNWNSGTERPSFTAISLRSFVILDRFCLSTDHVSSCKFPLSAFPGRLQLLPWITTATTTTTQVTHHIINLLNVVYTALQRHFLSAFLSMIPKSFQTIHLRSSNPIFPAFPKLIFIISCRKSQK